MLQNAQAQIKQRDAEIQHRIAEIAEISANFTAAQADIAAKQEEIKARDAREEYLITVYCSIFFSIKVLNIKTSMKVNIKIKKKQYADPVKLSLGLPRRVLKGPCRVRAPSTLFLKK